MLSRVSYSARARFKESSVETTSISLGFKAPYFDLPNTITGKNLKLSDLQINQGLLVMFICNHCPYVIHIMKELVNLANDYQSKGFTVVAISSNNIVKYPQDSPSKMKEVAEEYGFTFPYLYDESQDIAKAYDAVCTPDFSIFDSSLACVYRGQLDGSRPGSGVPVTGEDLRAVFDAILQEEPVNKSQTPSLGCSIKWK